MTKKHPRDGGAALSLSLSLGGGGEASSARAKKQPRRAAGGAEFVCRTCRRAFASFQALGGHRTGHLRGRHGLALGPPAGGQPADKDEPPPAAHECHREEAAHAPPVLLQLFV